MKPRMNRAPFTCLQSRTPPPKMQSVWRHLANAAMTRVLHRTETRRMKSWPCGWLILASLGISCLAGRCLAQPPDDKRKLIEQLPVPQSLNLEHLFKKMDKQTLDTALAAL